MDVRTHYDVLGVSPDASETAIREAYRRLAREHHPDRTASQGQSSAVGGQAATMPLINEAYRVLGDPGRRVVYDRALRGYPQRDIDPSPPGDAASPRVDAQFSAFHDRPARVPWRTLMVAGSFGIVGVVALAQFTGSAGQQGPDGILRNGDCVEIEQNNDAREIACTGTDDLVVTAFVPFDGSCPGGTEPHRDRQGMGVACVRQPVDG